MSQTTNKRKRAQEIRKKDKKYVHTIEQKTRRAQKERNVRILNHFPNLDPRPRLARKQRQRFSSTLPLDLSTYVKQLPLALVEYDPSSRSIKEIAQATVVLSLVLEDFTPLPQSMCRIISDYASSVLAFFMNPTHASSRCKMLSAWLRFLNAEIPPFDTRFGGLLFDTTDRKNPSSLLFRHARDKRAFQPKQMPTSSSLKLEQLRDWFFDYKYATDRTDEIVRRLTFITGNQEYQTYSTLGSSSRVLVGPWNLTLIPLLLDRITWSPLPICYGAQSSDVINVLNLK